MTPKMSAIYYRILKSSLTDGEMEAVSESIIREERFFPRPVDFLERVDGMRRSVVVKQQAWVWKAREARERLDHIKRAVRDRGHRMPSISSAARNDLVKLRATDEEIEAARGLPEPADG